MGRLRQGFSTNTLLALLFLSLGVRTTSDLFHTEGPLTSRAAFSVPCNACDLEATAVAESAPPPALPALTGYFVPTIVLPEARPFAPVIVHTQGRAPPAL